MLKIEKTTNQIKMYWSHDRFRDTKQELGDDVIELIKRYVTATVVDNSIIFNITGINDISGMKLRIIKNLKLAEEILTDKFDDTKYPTYDISKIDLRNVLTYTFSTRPEESSQWLNSEIYISKDNKNSNLYFHKSNNKYALARIKNDVLIVSSIAIEKNPDSLVKIKYQEIIEEFTSLNDLIKVLQ